MLAEFVDIVSAESSPVDIALEPLGVEDSATRPGKVCKEHTESDGEQEKRFKLLLDRHVQKDE